MLAAWVLLGGAAAITAYAYLAYPLMLMALAGLRRPSRPALRRPPSEWHWPPISILIPVHNAGPVLAETLETVLAAEYPGSRQVLVVSDASTDDSETITARFHARGVRCLRLPLRRGKTAAENRAARHLTGDIIVTVDAGSHIARQALLPLVAAFADPAVGVVSGHDVSVAARDRAGRSAEGDYVGYEMWVRRWETACGGIVGASGCFYAHRAHLYRDPVPEHLSRDFAAPLTARLRGYRAVAAPGALCHVRRTASLTAEYRRKARTMARGMATLWHFRALLQPWRHGVFAWMLFSHKVCRWLAPWALATAPLAASGLAAPLTPGKAALLGGATLAAATAALGLRRNAPRACRVAAYALAANLAALHAWVRFASGHTAPYWEPTRRDSTTLPGGAA